MRENVEQLGDREPRMAADEMQHAMMRAAEAVGLEQPVGVADEIPIGEEEQLDQIEHRRRLRARRARPLAVSGRSSRPSAIRSALLTYRPATMLSVAHDLTRFA